MNIFLCTDEARLLSEEAFEVYSPCMYKPAFDDYEKKMRSYLADRNVKIYLCDDNGCTAGMLVTELSDGILEIKGISVAEPYRKRGIGKGMILFALDECGTDSIRAQTDGDAVGFYRSCGFTAERTVKEYPDGVCVRYDCYFVR